jgi:glutamate N-acetyltransferase/amino-acid N-acetyltransferase
LADFRDKLDDLLIDLACQVVRDGEGAGKFVTLDVTGAASDAAARRIGLAIANSPLVKTAIAGGDANWGRIVMAVGKAGEKANRDRLKIAIGGTVVALKGQRRPDYDETPVAAHIRGREIHIAVDVGVGKGRARVWTCDLTHGYIDINADYRS